MCDVAECSLLQPSHGSAFLVKENFRNLKTRFNIDSANSTLSIARLRANASKDASVNGCAAPRVAVNGRLGVAELDAALHRLPKFLHF